MRHQKASTSRAPRSLSRRAAIVPALLVTVVIIIVAGVFLGRLTANKPERSSSSYCAYLKSNKTPQDWRASAKYYKELEMRAPDDIVQQTKTIRQTYEQMSKNPKDAVGLDLSVADTGSQFNTWVGKNCYSEGSTDPQQMLQQWSKDMQKSQQD